MIRMLIVGYRYGIRSERRLPEEVHLNLAYRWFCRLGLEGKVPEHSTFSENRHGRFRESDTFRLPAWRAISIRRLINNNFMRTKRSAASGIPVSRVL